MGSMGFFQCFINDFAGWKHTMSVCLQFLKLESSISGAIIDLALRQLWSLDFLKRLLKSTHESKQQILPALLCNYEQPKW